VPGKNHSEKVYWTTGRRPRVAVESLSDPVFYDGDEANFRNGMPTVLNTDTVLICAVTCIALSTFEQTAHLPLFLRWLARMNLTQFPPLSTLWTYNSLFSYAPTQSFSARVLGLSASLDSVIGSAPPLFVRNNSVVQGRDTRQVVHFGSSKSGRSIVHYSKTQRGAGQEGI
jgi:hypothetical protein